MNRFHSVSIESLYLVLIAYDLGKVTESARLLQLACPRSLAAVTKYHQASAPISLTVLFAKYVASPTHLN